MNQPQAPGLSVVVPAKDEAGRLPASVERLRRFLDEQAGAELVLAVDPGSDDGTLAVAEALATGHPRVRVVLAPGGGKGNAVLAGVREGRGEVVLMADADLAVDPCEFPKLWAAAADGAIAIASRSLPGARRIGEPSHRYAVGRAFNLAVRALVLPGVLDSQCGFKAFPRKVGENLLSRLRVRGWVFDVELLALARREGIPLVQVPVHWTYGPGGSLRLFRDAPAVVRDLLKVRLMLGRQASR